MTPEQEHKTGRILTLLSHQAAAERRIAQRRLHERLDSQERRGQQEEVADDLRRYGMVVH
jgi:hypothetical protein